MWWIIHATRESVRGTGDTIAEWLDEAVLVCNSSERTITELADNTLVAIGAGR